MFVLFSVFLLSLLFACSCFCSVRNSLSFVTPSEPSPYFLSSQYLSIAQPSPSSLRFPAPECSAVRAALPGSPVPAHRKPVLCSGVPKHPRQLEQHLLEPRRLPTPSVKCVSTLSQDSSARRDRCASREVKFFNLFLSGDEIPLCNMSVGALIVLENCKLRSKLWVALQESSDPGRA